MAKVGDTEMTVPPYGDATAQEPRCNTKVSTRCPEFCQLIGKRETKTTELSKRERDLRRRLEMLECWMPAVTMMGMMTRDIKADEIAGVIDKQVAGMTLSCLCPNSTLSQHRDVRIREVEGKRKKAMMRFEEARKLLNEKQTAVDRQNERIEEARRTRVMMEERVKLLEAKVSRYDNLGRATSAESVASIGPDELMYLTKLEELVKAEAASKKQLEELEKRQEMYVKALEAASQIWNDEERQESIASREDGLKSQLQVKSLANQQLADRICQLEDQVESLKSKLISCNDELKTYTERKSAEAMMGTDLTYRDVEVSIAPVLKDVSVIYDEVTVSGEKSPEAVLGPDGESRHLDLSGVTFREVSMIYDINFTVDEEVHAVAATESKETSAVIEFTERAVQEDIVQPQYDDAETATDGMQFVSLMAADATDATDGADADWQQSAVDGMQFVSLMAADATDAADADSQQSATHGMQFVSLMAADTTDAADADWQQSAAGDMQFVSLMED
ncbi:uncharacterized protein [Fopius arisanus]|uniref:Uncharacterized protein n=1 Tax=Fopius arisanus TaxID=64838 RepID=A0A9R1T9C0_9HYME|nr:PREDICTED: uncharacterized protein LOC105267890 [Fopius arisanus]